MHIVQNEGEPQGEAAKPTQEVRRMPEARLLWSKADYMVIAAHALPHLPAQEPAPGKTLSTSAITGRIAALKKGMRLALPRSAWRDDDALRILVGLNKSGLAFANAIAAVRAMPEPEREKLRTSGQATAHTSRQRSSSVPYAKRDYSGMVRWTDRELALLARRIKFWKDVQGLDYPWRHLYCLAQELELPPERRRSQAGITQGDYGTARNERHGNAAIFKAGCALIWTIDAKFPFDPDRRAWVDPSTPPPEPAEVVRLEVIEPPSPFADIEADGADRSACVEAAPALAPAPAPTPPSQRSPSIAEAARAFTEHIQRGVEILLAAHEQAIIGRMSSQVEALGRQLAVGITTQLRSSIFGTVHQALEQELGGPVTSPVTAAPMPPEAPATPAPDVPPDDDVADAEMMRRAAKANAEMMRSQTFSSDSGHHTLPQQQEAPPKFKLKIDVIGLFPRQIEEVRRAVNGGADLNFIDHDHPQQWQPHHADHVIVVSKGVNALILNRIRKEGVRPLMLREAGASGVVNAINEMKAAA